jgi:uncharacterized protein (DUF427 family)
MSKATIKEKRNGSLLAQGELPKEAFEFEGNIYFAPDKVQMTQLKVTERTYTCPYKGICFWIDLEAPTGVVRNVAWVYNNPKTGYEYIKDHIGFYKGTREGTVSQIE